MFSKQIRFVLFLTLCYTGAVWALPATNGTPLGGLGASYVKYNAISGNFSTGNKITPGAGNMTLEPRSPKSGFHFYANGKYVARARTTAEDAKIPVYTADFGSEKTPGVNFSLTACGPYVPGDNDNSVLISTSPMAFFQITARNDGAAAAEIAAALEFTNTQGMLGGANEAVVDPASASKGIMYADAKFSDIPTYTDNYGNAYIAVDCNKAGAVFSNGAIGSFATNGVLSNTDGNLVASKCVLEPGESVNIKFVMTWWRTFITGQDRYGAGVPYDEGYFYHNHFGTSKEVAEFGMQNFDLVLSTATSMVNRVTGSNFPTWYTDRLLNNLYPMVNNSVWTRDGRAAFWEGGYGIIGTIDQAQHAAIWYMHNWPKNQWLEMSYWLSNQFQDAASLGQIHHDFNIAPGLHFDPPESRFIAPWGHWDRTDYWFQPDTKDWSDLNSMLIFKAYELMIVTGNKDSMTVHYDGIKRTIDRLYNISQHESNAAIPLNSRSTYDSDGVITPQYACGVAVTAYKCFSEIARFVGKEEDAVLYESIYAQAREEYKTHVFNDDYGSVAANGWHEGHVGGYAWADYFCFKPMMDADFITAGSERAFDYYSAQPALKNKVGGWHLYCYDHLGGALTSIGQPDKAWQIHTWDHELCYKENPSLVYWQVLFSTEAGPGAYKSYMTAPSVWRSYFQFMGYLLDKAHQRLWIRPNLPTEMGNVIQRAALPSPYGWGTLNYDGNVNAETSKAQSIIVSYDAPVEVKEIILDNNTGGATPFVVLSDGATRFSGNANVGAGEGITVTTEDWGTYDQNIRITFATPLVIGPQGVAIDVFTQEVGVSFSKQGSKQHPLQVTSGSLVSGKPIKCSIDRPGKVTIELFSLNGSKIGTIVDRNVTSAGTHSFAWDGKTADGRNIGTMSCVLRLSTVGGTVSRTVMTLRK